MTCVYNPTQLSVLENLYNYTNIIKSISCNRMLRILNIKKKKVKIADKQNNGIRANVRIGGLRLGQGS